MPPDYSIEPELLKPPPRSVRLRGGSVAKKMQGCVGCFLIPHTLVGVGMALWFLWSVLLTVGGQSLPGQVTGRYSSYDSDGDPTYQLWYSYSQGGQKFEKKASVNAYSYGAYPEGTAVTVKVFPFLPHIAPSLQVPGNRTSASPFFLLIFCLFWNGIVGVFWWNILGVPIRQKKLIRTGTPVLGRVLFKRVVTGSYGDSHYVRYEYFANGQGQWGELPAIFAENAAANPVPAVFSTAPANSASPFTSSTGDPGSPYSATPQPINVTFSKTTKANKANWRELIEQARAQSKRDQELGKAAPSPGALAREESVNVQLFMAVQPGDWLTVLHAPSNPKSAIAYQFTAYEAF